MQYFAIFFLLLLKSQPGTRDRNLAVVARFFCRSDRTSTRVPWATPMSSQKELVTNLTLDILQIVKVSQSQHGLRHGDHARTGSTALDVSLVCTRLTG